MSKALIITATVLAALALIIAVLAAIAPKKIIVQNTQRIAAPSQVVYDQLRYLNNFPSWSPFRQQDPEQKYSVTGQDGQVGATFHWEGVREKSRGSQTIVALEDRRRVVAKCDITVPFEAKPTFDYRLAEKTDGVEITLDFEVDMPFPGNVFGMVFGLKKEMSATNQRGLDLLKQVCETQSGYSAK
jgi:hypothetical protein